MWARSLQNHAEHLADIGRTWSLHVALCGFVLVPIHAWPADNPRFTVELTSTGRSQTRTNHNRITATCIVGSNGWFVSGDFMRNARIDYWLVGTNVIEYRVVTSSMYLERAERFVSEKILQEKPVGGVPPSYPRAGDTFTTIHPSPLGQPVSWGVEGVIWLAFCSEDYLTQVDRQIPMPIGPSKRAFGYADKTFLLQEDTGLPANVELFATNGALVCSYEVTETTNYHGRTFPLRFRVIQHGQPARGAARGASVYEVLGKVISLDSASPPELPDDVQDQLRP